MRKTLGWAAIGATAATAAAVLSVTTMAGATTTPTKTPTALSVKVARGSVVPGGADVISGKLTSAGKAVPGKVVWLDRVAMVNGKPTLVKVEAKITDGTATKTPGAVAFTIHPQRTATYELVFAGDKTLAGSKSAAVTVKVAKLPTKLVAAASANPIKAGATDSITGTLTVGGKPLAHEPVALFKQVTINGAKKWVFVRTNSTTLKGTVPFIVKPAATATYEVVFLGTKTLAGSKSAPVTVTVTP